jgi:hypothetical protein
MKTRNNPKLAAVVNNLDSSERLAAHFAADAIDYMKAGNVEKFITCIRVAAQFAQTPNEKAHGLHVELSLEYRDNEVAA